MAVGRMELPDRQIVPDEGNVSWRDKMQHEQWCRVTKNDPCPICGRGDWCLVAKDKSAAICPRTEAGSVREIEGSGFPPQIG